MTTQPADPYARRLITYLEAGHAVMAWHLHRRFRYVTIRPEGNILGYFEEYSALAELTKRTLQPIDRQARWWVRCGFVRKGLLKLDQGEQEECMTVIGKE